MEGTTVTDQGRPIRGEERLVARLVRESYLEAGDGDRLLAECALRRASFCGALLELGLIPEKSLANILADELQIPILVADQCPLSPVLDGEVSPAFIKRSRVVPIDIDESRVVVAVFDPFDQFARSAFELMTGKRVQFVLAPLSELDDLIQKLYGAGRSSVDEIVDGIQGEKASDDSEAQRLTDMASEAPVVRLVNLMIARSVEAGASDIHFEVYEKKLLVRYRIDGVLHDLEAPPQHAARAITSRIKIMAKLNIAERRLPQDGRIRLPVRGKTVDFRVSIVPTLHGERIVMRVLDRGTSPKSFAELGLAAAVQAPLEQVLKKPNGIFLVTGPTGSGKTTTLYASLLTLPAKEKNILTVEDPIEFQLQDISQIQVKPQIGLTFANILRSILRQDPDIIFVGEIRDQETADIAVHAALTGHLVLSTLHTNTAAGAMARLLDMGVEDYLLATAVEGIMAQRLVRCLCPDCRKPIQLPGDSRDAEILRHAQGSSVGMAEITIYRPGGCDKCNGTGYRGRSAIAELLVPTEQIRHLVLRHAPAQEIHAAAVTQGMVTMAEDGLRKVLAGITSLEEVRQAVADLT